MTKTTGTLRPSRRTLLKETAVAGAIGLTAPYVAAGPATSRRGRTAANDKIRLGIIGVGPMGMANLRNCARHDDVEVTAICDVWKDRRDAAAAGFPGARTYDDHRKLLESGQVDAVIIATPPHWHTLQAVDACEAGVDIYLQKPMTLYPAEALVVRNAVAKTGRICQVGTQIHASENYRRVVEYVRSGKLGRIAVARTFNVMNQGSEGFGNPPDTEPPPGLDWERWVGPAPMRPFNDLIVRDAFHNCSFWDFSGGWTPGMAPHIIDLPHWALELDFPTLTTSTGGRHVLRDLGDVPDTQEVTWQHGDLTLTWSMSLVNSFGFDFGRGSLDRRLGIYFMGVDGTLFSDYGRHEIVPEGDRLGDASPPEHSIPSSPGHEREWLDCVRSRAQPSCNADYHCRIDVALGLANLAQRLGRSIRFDPVKERIVGDAEAAARARPEYRAPWRFPAEYLS
ncbi:MAG TPA: Gfo/Idh/MocA family oxidoreductase [Planctomycetota bacterium]|jgi:predicted dehydrogenase|nr:Gfo/Idh/MocA family oxidoreductase [Planctomycetota bacterium]